MGNALSEYDPSEGEAMTVEDELMSPYDLARMLDLVDCGGWIVSSSKCSPQEIAWAQAERRMFVSSDGCGYVVRPAASLPAAPLPSDGAGS